jgi:hypothetical protein
MLASVILPLPDSDRKTELNFSVNDSNTNFYLSYLPWTYFIAKHLSQAEDFKPVNAFLQGQNPLAVVSYGFGFSS